MPVKTDYTREELIAICEDAIRPQNRWHDRDSYDAQLQVGQCWALLLAGCDYKVHDGTEDRTCATTEDTIWLTTYGKGFAYFENHEPNDPPHAYMEDELHYLPTRKRLDEVGSGDWY